jgi:hypothetical protein
MFVMVGNVGSSYLLEPHRHFAIANGSDFCNVNVGSKYLLEPHRHLQLQMILMFVMMMLVPVNLLNTKRSLLYISNQSVPHCKHFPPWL